MKKIKLGKIKIKKKNKENNANTSKKGKVKSIVFIFPLDWKSFP